MSAEVLFAPEPDPTAPQTLRRSMRTPEGEIVPVAETFYKAEGRAMAIFPDDPRRVRSYDEHSDKVGPVFIASPGRSYWVTIRRQGRVYAYDLLCEPSSQGQNALTGVGFEVTGLYHEGESMVRPLGPLAFDAHPAYIPLDEVDWVKIVARNERFDIHQAPVDTNRWSAEQRMEFELPGMAIAAVDRYARAA